jgi:HAD superfamily hydrolase (TIGR01509 family)
LHPGIAVAAITLSIGERNKLRRCCIQSLEQARALILDFDGVIVDSEGMQLEAVNLVLAGYGIRLQDEDWITFCVGHKTRDILERLLGDSVDSGEFDRLVAAKSAAYRSLVQAGQPVARPGIRELIQQAQAAGYRCGIASATPEADIRDVVSRLDLASYFDAIVSADAVPRPKPAPDVYLRAAALLGVEPSRCVIVEDTPTGLAAGRAAGMRCVAFPNRWTAGMDLGAADYLVRTLDRRAIQYILQ